MKTLFYHLHMGHPRATEFTDAGIRQAYAEAVALGQIRVYAVAGPDPDLSSVTVCRLVDDGGAEVARGYAFCSSRDQFCKRTGRLIAEGRAQKRLEETSQRRNYSEHADEFRADESMTMGDPGSHLREDGTPR